MIAPVLEAAVADVLRKQEEAWFEFLTDPGTHSLVSLFHYRLLFDAVLHIAEKALLRLDRRG